MTETIAFSPRTIRDATGNLEGRSSTTASPGAKKLQGSTDRWRIRVGDYRIIYRIVDSERQVLVNRIAQRREAYRPSARRPRPKSASRSLAATTR